MKKREVMRLRGSSVSQPSSVRLWAKSDLVPSPGSQALSDKARQIEENKKESRGRDAAQAKIDANIQAQNDIAKAKMSEEIKVGRHFFESADGHAQKELCHSFISQLIPQRLIEKQGVSREALRPDNILNVNRVVADAFCSHVFAKTKKAPAGNQS
jgi:hypothetical protein